MPAVPAPLRVVLADDEPPARELVASLLADEPDFALAAACADGRAAVAAVCAEQPDLLILDVQMPEMDGFGVLAELATLGEPLPPPVIFTTAWDRHAVRAFEVHALDYLLKPFGPDRFARALQRARDLLRSPADLAAGAARLRELAPPAPYLHRLLLRGGGRIHFRDVSELDWAEAEGNYVRLHFGTESHLQRETLSALEVRLDPARFARPHRSALVNIARIRELRPVFHGAYVVVLKNGREIPLGRPWRERFLRQVSEG